MYSQCGIHKYKSSPESRCYCIKLLLNQFGLLDSARWNVHLKNSLHLYKHLRISCNIIFLEIRYKELLLFLTLLAEKLSQNLFHTSFTSFVQFADDTASNVVRYVLTPFPWMQLALKVTEDTVMELTELKIQQFIKDL